MPPFQFPHIPMLAPSCHDQMATKTSASWVDAPWKSSDWMHSQISIRSVLHRVVVFPSTHWEILDNRFTGALLRGRLKFCFVQNDSYEIQRRRIPTFSDPKVRPVLGEDKSRGVYMCVALFYWTSGGGHGSRGILIKRLLTWGFRHIHTLAP